ncbi:hypothetical protein B0H14DRAFT_2159967, partial [Mycena olivaceomarginata]
RSLYDICWGCLTTIFACAWLSVHPNVPPPDPEEPVGSVGRRLKLMLITVIAPELMVGFAARQFIMSRYYSAKFRISTTHGYFIAMGGFIAEPGGYPLVSTSHLELHREELVRVSENAIMDKNKGDALSRIVALCQAVWFLTHCLARVFRKLPVSELETTTAAFAVINVFIRLLWWGKPLNAQVP